jgi:hypothetical protein
MDYNASKSDYALVTGLWRVFVPSERGWNKAVQKLPGLLKPAKESFYSPHAVHRTGYQLDLMHWQLTVGEDELPFCYPDW